MGNRQKILPIILFFLISVGVIAGLVWANYRFAQENPGGNDFLARWMGANYWLKKGISPYDPQVSLATQIAIYGHPANPEKGEDVAHFVYPLTAMIFFGPFGLLDYFHARVIWMTLLEVSLFGLAFISLRLVNWEPPAWKTAVLLLFSLLWYHGVRTIIIGQFAGLNAFFITLALFFVVQKQDFAAGILFALSTAKPQMVFLLIPFILLWAISAGRRDLLWGTLLGTGMLLLASLLLLPSWPIQMLSQMLQYTSYTDIGSPISIIANAMPGIGRQVSIFLHVLILLYLGFEWVSVWGKGENQFLWTAMLTVVVTNFVAFRTATTNYVMMLPALFLIFRIWEMRWRNSGRWGVWISILFFGVGLWVLFFLTVKGNVESAVMYLPLPFFCLIGLWWVRWWAVQPPRVYLDELVERVK